MVIIRKIIQSLDLNDIVDKKIEKIREPFYVLKETFIIKKGNRKFKVQLSILEDPNLTPDYEIEVPQIKP